VGSEVLSFRDYSGLLDSVNLLRSGGVESAGMKARASARSHLDHSYAERLRVLLSESE
jgi:hypothetical protein